jgi:hypothetical protein
VPETLTPDDEKLQFLALQAYAYRQPRHAPGDQEHAPPAAARAIELWPSTGSPWLRLAALAFGIDHEFDELMDSAKRELATWRPATKTDRPTEPDELLVLPVLVLLEHMDYDALLAVPGKSTPLRDGLSGDEDRATITAMVRFDLAVHRRNHTPDSQLNAWRHWVGFMTPQHDRAEFSNLLDIRDHLQQYLSILTIAGQAEWSPSVDAVDVEFRNKTVRHPVPFVSTEPAGWWRYRVREPDGVDASGLDASVSTKRFVHSGKPWSPGIRPAVELWRWVDRPNGVASLTNHELLRVLPSFRLQASHELRYVARHGTPAWPSTWTTRFNVVREELIRRGHDIPDVEPAPERDGAESGP